MNTPPRDRLDALVSNWARSAGTLHDLSLAAYKMAIKDAARACGDERLTNATPRNELARWHNEAVARCAAAVSALAERM